MFLNYVSCCTPTCLKLSMFHNILTFFLIKSSPVNNQQDKLDVGCSRCIISSILVSKQDTDGAEYASSFDIQLQMLPQLCCYTKVLNRHTLQIIQTFSHLLVIFERLLNDFKNTLAHGVRVTPQYFLT